MKLTKKEIEFLFACFEDGFETFHNEGYFGMSEEEHDKLWIMRDRIHKFIFQGRKQSTSKSHSSK